MRTLAPRLLSCLLSGLLIGGLFALTACDDRAPYRPAGPQAPDATADVLQQEVPEVDLRPQGDRAASDVLALDVPQPDTSPLPDVMSADVRPTDAQGFDGALDGHLHGGADRPGDAAANFDAGVMGCLENPALAGLVHTHQAWSHLPAGTEVVYAHDPPASGPHFAQWARSGIYEPPASIDRRNFVHNLEHGWMVLIYRPNAPAAAIDILEQAYNAGFVDGECPMSPVPRIIVTQDPLLASNVAALTADLVLEGEALTLEQLRVLFESCRGAATELRVCADGSVPAPAPASMMMPNP